MHNALVRLHLKHLVQFLPPVFKEEELRPETVQKTTWEIRRKSCKRKLLELGLFELHSKMFFAQHTGEEEQSSQQTDVLATTPQKHLNRLRESEQMRLEQDSGASFHQEQENGSQVVFRFYTHGNGEIVTLTSAL